MMKRKHEADAMFSIGLLDSKTDYWPIGY